MQWGIGCAIGCFRYIFDVQWEIGCAIGCVRYIFDVKWGIGCAIGCVCYILASLVCMSKREDLKNKGKCFLFHFESPFHF